MIWLERVRESWILGSHARIAYLFDVGIRCLPHICRCGVVSKILKVDYKNVRDPKIDG